MQDQKIEKMLEINRAQKEYYEVATGANLSKANSIGTNIWRTLRQRAFGIFAQTNRAESIDELHRQWIGDVSDKKVLDFGVGDGNPLSMELAKNAREYVAIDLSESRIAGLKEKMGKAGINNASLYSADFLSEESFSEDKFDVIYAMAIFHHFEHMDALLDVIEKKLAPGGRVVTYDPVQVWVPIRILRAIYRPLQTDAAWEHPFGERSMTMMETRFKVLNCQGILGKSKWASAVGILSPKLGSKLAQRWHNDDLQKSVTPAKLRSCLHVSYHLQKK